MNPAGMRSTGASQLVSEKFKEEVNAACMHARACEPARALLRGRVPIGFARLQVVVISDDDDDDDDDRVRGADKHVSKAADSASVKREPASDGTGWRVPKHTSFCSSYSGCRLQLDVQGGSQLPTAGSKSLGSKRVAMGPKPKKRKTDYDASDFEEVSRCFAALV